jgi:two-component system, LytTR family, sensor histidine kinase AlgZ
MSRWFRIFLGYVAVAIGIAIVFSDIGAHTPWRRIVEAIATSFLFGICIGPMVGVTMPRIAPWVWRRLRFPFNWIAIAATMAAQALIGSAIAIVVLMLIGYLSAADFWPWYVGSMRVSIVVTLTIGLFITAHEMNVARLAQATTKAQLAALESRVQPHFLFNTLNSIAALTHDDPQRAERMTTELASLLRSSLDSQHTPLVPLADELQIVRNYLEIERVRFGDRLRYVIDADDASKSAPVPRLAIQTLVENSVKYAVSPRREGASIGVRAAAVNGHLRVEVSDDGPGFDSASLPEGHGLALLRSRLQMLFADRASLRVTSQSSATSVTIDVPIDGGVRL